MPDQSNLVRIHRITSDLMLWQGLRLVPIGALLLGLSARHSRLWPLAVTSDLAFAAFAVGTLFAFARLGSYYRRRFGCVTPIPGAHERRDRIKWQVVYPLMLVALLFDLRVAPAFFISGPVWAAAIVAYWWSTGRGRPHYFVAAAAMLGLSAVQSVGLVRPGRPMGSLFVAVLGVIYIVGGTLDHLELTRILKPVDD